MAELFIATSPGEHGFQKKVVIKRLLPHLVADETYNAMFIDEAKLTARLVHPKIAQTFELGKVDDALFIAMEYIDGIDVLAVLREYAAKRRRVEPRLAAWIAHETLDALDYAHNVAGEDGKPLGIVHRDISPSNVLLSARGDVKLVDFGIARAKDPDRAHKSKSGTLKGKYGYMSPEQVIELQLDARSDVFSVGIVLAELLTGRRLFAAANELDVLLMVRDAKLARFEKYGADLEPGLAEIVRKALKKPLDERWSSAAAFRDALSEWLFEHRYRITPKQIADIVVELRDAVNERRNKTIGVPANDEEIAVSRAPSEDAPILIIDAEPSVPVIQIEPEPPDEPGKRAVTASELIASTPHPAPKRAPTESGKQKVMVVPPLPAPAPPPKTVEPSERKAFEELELDTGGAVAAPIADTISAAIGALRLPDLPAPPRATPTEPMSPLARPTEPMPPLTRPPALELDPELGLEDSMLRNFDDVLSDDEIEADVPIPTPEEALRKKPPTPPALADIPEPPDDSGDFSATSPLRVLFRLMTARATGLLVVAVGGIKKEIYVRDGQPEYVSSNVASELFGNYLVSKGVLSDGELAMALAMMPHYGGKLGDTLVGLGLLKPLEVFRHLTRQVRSKIIDVCTWNKGGFGWYSGRENPREAFPLDFNAFEILGAGAMALAEEHIESWVAKHGALKLRASRTRRVGPERFEVKGLVEVCDQLDGKRSIAELVEQHAERTDRIKLGRMLCLLESCDLARPG